MKILKFTDEEGKVFLINLDNVSHIIPDDKKGSVIYTTRKSPPNIISVKESIDEIKQLIDVK